MNVMETSDWIQIGILVVAMITVFCSCFYSNKAIKVSTKSALAQSQAQLYAEYTHRYQELILKMPISIYRGIAKFDDENIIQFMRMYFDLCSEEHYLHDKGIILQDVWDMWKDGMKLNMEKDIYLTSWKMLRGEYNESFQYDFEHEIINKRNSI